MTRHEATRPALLRAQARLDSLDLYPRPVDLHGVRVLLVPWLFRLPRLRRYRGYALRRTILLRRALEGVPGEDLITHELCHVWQMQHRPFHVVWTYATRPYRENPYEREAREAVAATRGVRSGSAGVPGRSRPRAHLSIAPSDCRFGGSRVPPGRPQ